MLNDSAAIAKIRGGQNETFSNRYKVTPEA
jgi:hypothetical protein